MKRCSTSFTTIKIQIKTTMRYNYILIQMANMQMSDNTKS